MHAQGNEVEGPQGKVGGQPQPQRNQPSIPATVEYGGKGAKGNVEADFGRKPPRGLVPAGAMAGLDETGGPAEEDVKDDEARANPRPRSALPARV